MKRARSIIMALASAVLLATTAFLSAPLLMAQDAGTQTTGNRRAYVVHRAATVKVAKTAKKAKTKKAARSTAARASTSSIQPVGTQADGAATANAGRRR